MALKPDERARLPAASEEQAPNRTGLVVEGCYAGALGDCEGKLEAEHFVSRNLLEQLGKTFIVTGLPWAGDGKRASPKSVTGHVLCARHNRALSPIDATAGRFYDVLMRVINGEAVGEHTFEGEHLERWALKLLLGVAASGNIGNTDGERLRTSAPPVEWLQILFGEREMPANCGFTFVPRLLSGMEASTNLAWQLARGPSDDNIYGITIKVANWFQFLTTFNTPISELGGAQLIHRPTGFVLGVPREQGHIKLRWKDRPYSGSLILKLNRP